MMKKILTLTVSLVFICLSVQGQAPEKMSYQAVIRDAADALIVNQGVGIQVSVLQGSAAGTAVYVETHSATTNMNGLVSLEIGMGTAMTGTFSAIDWSGGPYFLKTETDPTTAGGTTYTITGATELLSVPYALHAKNGISSGGTEGQVLQVVGGVPSWVTVATCYDGIMNQDETGIDCGGATCTACLLSVQELLDAGTTPCDVINVHGHTLSDLYGKTYAGGLIFYLITSTCTGMVAAPSDQSTGADWGCFGTIIEADGTAIETGAQNTIDIVAGCATVGTAAGLCANLTLNTYSDWFLPSKDELDAMYINLKVNGFGGFAAGWYWSSTENGDRYAWEQNFYIGNQCIFYKNVAWYVRAVRAF